MIIYRIGLADFRGIDRYVALHYLVQFSAEHENTLKVFWV